MYGIFTYMFFVDFFMVDVGKYMPYVDAMCYDNDSFIFEV